MTEKFKQKLIDTIWYYLCYSRDVPDKDLKKYAEMVLDKIMEVFADEVSRKTKEEKVSVPTITGCSVTFYDKYDAGRNHQNGDKTLDK